MQIKCNDGRGVGVTVRTACHRRPAVATSARERFSEKKLQVNCVLSYALFDA
jgi:hypothetical protein